MNWAFGSAKGGSSYFLRLILLKLGSHRRAGTAGRLDFSRAAEADRYLAGLNDYGDFSSSVGEPHHAFQAGLVFQYIDVFEGNLSAGEVLTGSRSVWSKVLAKN